MQEAVSHAEQTVAAHDTYQQAHADASRWIEENERALQRCLQSGHEKDETEDNLAVLKVCENTPAILCVHRRCLLLTTVYVFCTTVALSAV